MATPLRLPAHADIHEFGVMFTKSVKKKAKDWHDGYLKWHTFNYRAILYDDQRKPVANEFFPNKNISSNSELEFSNAIVQIGDQLETIQANLEHIYRTTAQKPAAEVETQTVFRARNMTETPTHRTKNPSTRLTTPSVTRTEQKRIYPVPASRIRRTLVLPSTAANPAEQTPVRDARSFPRPRSKLNTPHPTRHVQYPNTSARTSADSIGPGWFARQDQVVMQRETDETELTAHAQPTPGPTGRASANARYVESAVSTAIERPQLKRKRQLRKQADSNDSTRQSRTNNCEAEDIQTSVEIDSSSISTEMNEEHNACSTKVRKESKLDPTRAVNKPKRRELLAAKRHRTGSAEALRAQSETEKLAVVRLREQSGLTKSLAKTSSLSKAVPADKIAIYDIDSSSWVPEAPSTAFDSGPSLQFPAKRGAQTQTEITEMSADTHIELMREHNSDYLEADRHGECAHLRTHTAQTPGDYAAIRAGVVVSPVNHTHFQRGDHLTMLADAGDVLESRKADLHSTQDDDIFVPIGTIRNPAKRVPGFPEVEPGSSKFDHASKKLTKLIEQFPESPALVKSNNIISSSVSVARPNIPESPLFLPDFGASQEVLQASQPGLFTQLASKAAQDIARHSSINKLVHNKTKNKKLPCKTVVTKMRITRTTESITCDHTHRSHTALPAPVKTQPYKALASTTTRQSFPPTPVEIETAELSQLFDDEESEKAEIVLNDKGANASARVLQESKHVLNTENRNESNHQVGTTDDNDLNFKIATQINGRAPDFMSAKSFQCGARLQLDKPIAAVGMSARELAALDLSTQLSGEAAQRNAPSQDCPSP